MVVQSKFSKIMIPTLSAIIAIILVGGGAIFLAYRAGLFDITKIPVIKAPDGPVKEECKENCGGEFIPHIGMTVYKTIDNDSDNEISSSIEIIPLPKEVPELPSVFISDDNSSVIDDINAQSDDDNSSNIRKSDKISKSTNDSINKKDNTFRNKTNTNEENFDNSSLNSNILIPIKRPKYGYYVQLASFNNEEKAKKSVKILNEKLAVSLEGHLLEVMSIDLGLDKGIWWRIVTEFLERDKAESICALLKAEGQGCIIRTQ